MEIETLYHSIIVAHSLDKDRKQIIIDKTSVAIRNSMF